MIVYPPPLPRLPPLPPLPPLPSLPPLPPLLSPTPSLLPGDHGLVRFGEERDIGGVVSTTFTFLRETWRELGLGLLYIAGPVLLLTAVASYFMQTRLFGIMGELEQADPNDPEAFFGLFGGLMGPSYVLAVFGGLVAGVLVTAVVYAYVRLYRAGEAGRISPGALWGEASHLLGRSLRVWLVEIAALTLCIAGMALFCLGLVVLISILPALALAVPGVVLAGRSVRGGLSEGWELAQRAWFATLGVVMVSGLIWYAINVALTLPSSVAGMLIGLNSANADFEVSGTTRALMAAGTVLGAFGYLFYSIPLVAAALQYYSLVEGVTGGGLTERVAALEQPPRQPAESTAPPPLPGADAPAPGTSPGQATAHGPGFRGRGFDDEA